MSYDPMAHEHRRTIREAHMPSAAEILQGEIPEFVRVEQWRWDCLTDAGVGFDVAHRLSRSRGDLHRILDAKAAGATDEQLLAIFDDDGFAS